MSTIQDEVDRVWEEYRSEKKRAYKKAIDEIARIGERAVDAEEAERERKRLRARQLLFGK